MPLTLSNKALNVKPSSTLAITAKAKAFAAAGIDIVGFTAGEPDFNTPNSINEVAIQAINDGVTKYTPACGTMDLKKAICEKFKSFNNLTYEPEQIVISNGAKHSLSNIFDTLLNPGDEVIIPTPYWLTYPEIVKLADGIPVYVYGEKENAYKVTASQIEAAVTANTKILVLNSPNNPTGAVYSKEELQEIAKIAIRHDFYVIADEIYEQLIYGDKMHVSIASLGPEIYERTITVSGVSKSYAMTGWRIGYTGSNVEIAKVMGNLQSHKTSNPNSIAQKATIEALQGDQSALEVMKQAFGERRDYMYKRLVKMPYLDVLSPEGAFYIFIDIEEVLGKTYKGNVLANAQEFVRVLLEEYQVVVVLCDDFGMENHMRLSYAISLEEIQKGLERLETFLYKIQ